MHTRSLLKQVREGYLVHRPGWGSSTPPSTKRPRSSNSIEPYISSMRREASLVSLSITQVKSHGLGLTFPGGVDGPHRLSPERTVVVAKMNRTRGRHEEVRRRRRRQTKPEVLSPCVARRDDVNDRAAAAEARYLAPVTKKGAGLGHSGSRLATPMTRTSPRAAVGRR